MPGAEMTEQLKALAEAATKGPWKHYGLDGGHLVFEDAAGSSIASSIGRNHVENAKYIAAANPERILALIAENERLTQANLDLTTTLRLATKRRSEPDSGMEIMKL